MNHFGKVGRARLALNVELTLQARSEGWFRICELRSVLVERGLAEPECFGRSTFAHSRKRRGNSYLLAREVCRGCEGHHFFVLDLLPPKLAEMIVLECIARRNHLIER
jgi:hypothetical protein